ncbi:uroporphyrinogen-III synthase [Arthrobacter sp. NamB2]|nr:uroporphyrinogen-III synthase [Arthrobacter sp. NamB2]
MARDRQPVLVLRHPERAVRIAEALGALGLASFALPLTDSELPADVDAVGAELHLLGSGRYRWLTITSANTVTALGMVAASQGTSLARVVRAGGSLVAAVGSATARSLAEAGIAVDLVPQDASSAGLLAEFPRGRDAVLLPQADLAPDDLRAGLAALGWTVQRVEAYRTVPYPAEPERRVAGVVEQGTPPPLIALRELATMAADGVQPAIVFTAPSTVRQFHEKLGEGSLAFFPVAIGRATATALREQGWEPGATAADPTPLGIARAVDEALSRGSAVTRVPAPPLNGDQP